MKYNLREAFAPDGKIKSEAIPLLKEAMEEYPFFHAARIVHLRALYEQRDPRYNEELRMAAISLPSRAKVYYDIEGENLRPKPATKALAGGATNRRKSLTPLSERPSHGEDRTGLLINNFLQATPSILLDEQSGRPIDATTDYMSYFLQEEAQRKKGEQTDSGDENERPANTVSGSSDSIIDEYISTRGDQRIRLTDRKDSDLQKPVIETDENTAQKGVFTETLARIYIKQGKFEQAIEIIKRLSLKYPKKNRYFADQIRFLEKIILNNNAAKGEKKES